MNGFHAFTLFRIPVHISIWFFVIIAYWGMTGNDVQSTIIWGVSITLGLLVHEFGHGLVARHFRLSPKILLHGLGGLCAHERAKRDRDDALIIIAGPAAGFALGGLAYLTSALLIAFAPDVIPTGGGLDRALTWTFWLCIFWNGLNLLPLWPLDGGQLFRLGLLQKLAPVKAEAIAHKTGIAVGVLGAYYAYTSGWVIVAVISAYMAFMNYQQLSSSKPSGAIRPKNTLAIELLDEASDALNREDWREAERLAHQIRSLNNLSDATLQKTWFMLAVSTFEQGEYESTLRYTKRAKPSREITLITLRSLIELGRHREAAEVLHQNPVDLPPDLAQAMLQ